jgi:hypothetical protein
LEEGKSIQANTKASSMSQKVILLKFGQKKQNRKQEILNRPVMNGTDKINLTNNLADDEYPNLVK